MIHLTEITHIMPMSGRRSVAKLERVLQMLG
jgi:hypothetical protein